MKPEFLNGEDAYRKLSGSIIFWKGEPVYIEAVNPILRNDRLTVSRLAGCRKEIPPEIHYNDPDFDLSSPELGYITHDGKTSYCSRNPLRQNVIGISMNTLHFTNNVTAGILKSGGMYNMLKNKYDDFSTAVMRLKTRNNNGEPIPFHRKFALGKGTLAFPLYYRGDVIGAYHPIRNQFILTPSDAASFVARIMEAELSSLKVPVIN